MQDTNAVVAGRHISRQSQHRAEQHILLRHNRGRARQPQPVRGHVPPQARILVRRAEFCFGTLHVCFGCAATMAVAAAISAGDKFQAARKRADIRL